jgi:hypothetical protein
MGTGTAQSVGTGNEGGTGGKHIVDQKDTFWWWAMITPEKCSSYVALARTPPQACLVTSITSTNQTLPAKGNSPTLTESPSQFLGLVEPPLGQTVGV